MVRKTLAGSYRLLELYEIVKSAGRENEEREKIVKALTKKMREDAKPKLENDDEENAREKI